MRYTVKSQDGELTFESMAQLRQMYQQGLVEPDDQVRAEGWTEWREAGAIPELAQVEVSRPAEQRWVLWGLAAATSLLLSLVALVRYRSLTAAMLLMIPVLVMSQRAFTKVIKRRS